MRRSRQEEPQDAALRPCNVSGCPAPGEHRAPLARDRLDEYQWLCLDHVREFNKSWDYFSGMSADEIEEFRSEAVTGHRPTWQREDHMGKTRHGYAETLQEELRRFFNWGSDSAKAQRPRDMSNKEFKALKAMELAGRVGVAELKSQYRVLVKRHHPDLHSGDREQEEKFKQVTTAYSYLLKLYEE